METVEVLVGTVGRAHGVRGELVIDARTDEPGRRFAAGVRFETSRGPLTIVGTRWHGQRLLARFAEVSDRTAAESWRGVELRLQVPADERPTDPEEFYDHQLEGLSVRTTLGADAGVVADVLHLPAQDVLVVRRGAAETLVPFVAAVVPTVDVASGQVVVDHSSGLFDAIGDEPTAGEGDR
ncbi:MAG: ribosome maturation factor RimM [Nocardioidaceae bacterium]